MMTDTEIRVKGVETLTKALGMIEAERFIALMIREPFDYTKWRQGLFEGQTLDEISAAAKRLRDHSESVEKPGDAS
jgi:hypothetical protein